MGKVYKKKLFLENVYGVNESWVELNIKMSSVEYKK